MSTQRAWLRRSHKNETGRLERPRTEVVREQGPLGYSLRACTYHGTSIRERSLFDESVAKLRLSRARASPFCFFRAALLMHACLLSSNVCFFFAGHAREVSDRVVNTAGMLLA